MVAPHPAVCCTVIIFSDRRCTEYSAPGHPERPARIERSAPLLQQRHPDWEWREPNPAAETAILRAHSSAHLERVRAAASAFDADTPAYPGIFEHALRATGSALAVAGAALSGSAGFSLM